MLIYRTWSYKSRPGKGVNMTEKNAKASAMLLALLIVLSCPFQVFGWGAGHDHVNKLSLELMPSEIKTFLGETYATKLVRWSHTPDNFTPWEKVTHISITPEDLAILKAYGMKHPYSLHGDRGQAINFVLLIHAFRARDVDRATLWMACLLHTFADEAACNHDPLIHYMTYAFKEYGMNMGKGIGLDFSDIVKTKEGDTIIHTLLNKVRIVPLADNRRQALLKVMMAGLEGNAYMTQRGSRIAATYAINASDKVLEDGMRAMAELGVYGIEHALNAIVTAWNFAKDGTFPDLNDEIMEESKREAAEFGRNRPLRYDSIFAELLEDATETQPSIGAIVEPSVSMDHAKFCFSAKFIMASVMRTIRNAGIPYRLVDIRMIEEQGLPEPKTMPLLIVCSGKFSVSKNVKEHIKAYTRRGGRLLWIGGEHQNQLGEFSKILQRAANQLLPVSKKYGKDSPVVKKARVVFRSAFREVLGNKEYSFTHNPNTKAGWQKPRCSYVIKSGGNHVRVLAELLVDDTTMSIAAAWENGGGKTKYVFLPEYLVAPYLFSEETTIKDPSRPVLDSVAEKIILASLRLLVPGMVRK